MKQNLQSSKAKSQIAIMHKDFNWGWRYTGAGRIDFTEEGEKM